MRIIVDFYKRLSTLQRSLISALIGFAFYGAWAIFVNFMHGKESAIKAGLVQGGYSFILTFFMTLLLEAIYLRALHFLKSELAAIVITVVTSCTIVFSGSWLVNYLSGTPEIFNTVILGYIFGGLYSIAYTIGLAKEGWGLNHKASDRRR